MDQKKIIKKSYVNWMNNNILRYIDRQRRIPGALSSRELKAPHILKGMDFSILVYWYDAVTPFGQEVQEGPLYLPPEQWFGQLVIINQISLRVFAAFLPLELGSLENIDDNSEERLVSFRAMNLRSPISWWGCLSSTDTASAKGTTGNYDFLRRW